MLSKRSAEGHSSPSVSKKPNETNTPENIQRVATPGFPGIIHGQETFYVETEVENVHLAGEIVHPSEAKEDFQDDDDPVVLVITKRTRDNFLQYLKQFAPTAQVANTESSQMKNTDTQVHNQPQDQPDEFLRNILNSKDYNYSCAAGLKRQFENTCSKLDGIQLDFRESELKENLATSSETEQFREVRKNLNGFLRVQP